MNKLAIGVLICGAIGIFAVISLSSQSTVEKHHPPISPALPTPASPASTTSPTSAVQTESVSSQPPVAIPTPVKPSTGIWRIANYVDEFGDPTKQKYIRNNVDIFGKFSNSATTDSELRITMMINSKNNVDIQLFEYGGNHPVLSYGTSTFYRVSMKDKDGKINSDLHAINHGDRLSFDAKSIYVHNILMKGGKVQFHIRGDYGTTYDFAIDATGYANIYKEFRSTK